MFTRIWLFAALVACALIVSACGNSDSNDPTDITAPSATPTPASGLLGTSDIIVIHFNESMYTNPAAFSIAGTMAVESDGGIWTTDTNTGDTLTISPSGNWSVDTRRTLIVNAKDLDGNPVATVLLTYDVYSGTLYYVSPNAPNDSGNGLSPATARKTINSTVDWAATRAGGGMATVLVESGPYFVGTGGSGRILLRTNVSLYGGYDPTFTTRTPGSSTIVDISDFATTIDNPHYAMYGFTGVTATTLVDGFTIQGTAQPGSNYTSAIRLYDGASPRLQNNSINGGGGVQSYGLHNTNGAAPIVRGNTIHGGSGSDSHGTYNTSSSPVVQNNTVHGGSGSNSFGIYSTSSSPLVRNNTVHGGSGVTTSSAIANQSSSPMVENNILLGGSGAASTCYAEYSITMPDGHDPQSLHNNAFFGCDVMYRDQDSGCSYSGALDGLSLYAANCSGCHGAAPGTKAGRSDIQIQTAIGVVATMSGLATLNTGEVQAIADAIGGGIASCTTIDQINALTDITGGAGDNVTADPMFVDIDGLDNNLNTMYDNDWHFSMASPASIASGGLNGIDEIPSWTFTDDFDGVSRPGSGNPWSMGAYEP